MASPLPGQPLTFRARGLSDAQDSSNAFRGAMTSLADLIPNPRTKNQFVPRPAAQQLTNFAGSALSQAGVPNALLTVGSIAYGMCPDGAGPFAGLDVPFAYNTLTNAFLPISIPGGAADLPTSPAALGDWTPPTMVVVASRVLVTHPGFAGGAKKFGWLDVSGFTDSSHTGSTHTSTLIDTLSANVLQAGWQVGMAIAGAGIQANTTIVSIAADGLSLVLSKAATATAAGVALTVTGGTAAAPLWASGDTNGNNLASVPVAVSQFNGRAYFAVGAGLVFSDAGNPCQVTNATQAVSFRNGVNVTGMGGIGLFSSTVGGIIQSLMAFQGDAQVWQVQGDITFTSGLTINALLSGVGTLAPNTIEQTPFGLAFVAPDGVRIIDATAKFSDPIGHDGDGVVAPFLFAINPSRMVASYNQGVYRITVINGGGPQQLTQEYWLDMTRKIWTGPHSFPCAMIAALQGVDNSFVCAGVGIAGKLFQSDPEPGLASTYVEQGAQMKWTWQTCLLPDNESMSQNAMVLAQLMASIGNGQTMTVICLNEQGSSLATVVLNGPTAKDTVWGQFTWGQAPWGGPGSVLFQHPLPWAAAVVFKQMSVRIQGSSAPATIIGNLYMQLEELDYVTDVLTLAPSAPIPVPAPPPTSPTFDSPIPTVFP
jgi:hypothetical protein